MSGSKKKDYEIGYGATRWQRGQSGNPGGRRPKGKSQKLDPGKILQSIDNEEIYVVVDGKRKRMPKAEIHFQQLFTKGIKGNLTTARLLVKMATEYFVPEEAGSYDSEIIGETEAVRRFGRNWQKRVDEFNARFRV
jgi:hypothetical protein